MTTLRKALQQTKGPIQGTFPLAIRNWKQANQYYSYRSRASTAMITLEYRSQTISSFKNDWYLLRGSNASIHDLLPIAYISTNEHMILRGDGYTINYSQKCFFVKFLNTFLLIYYIRVRKKEINMKCHIHHKGWIRQNGRNKHDTNNSMHKSAYTSFWLYYIYYWGPYTEQTNLCATR